MNTVIHFIDVGQGNMVLIEAADGSFYICDCNVTNDNEGEVMDYLGNVVGWGSNISAFICTHRDADHMRGINKIHRNFPIQQIWDSGYPGTTTNSSEYLSYMNLRRSVGAQEKRKCTYRDIGRTRINYLSAKDDRLEGNANAQGLVMKVEHWNEYNEVGASVMLTGDCDAETWRYGILKDYSKSEIKSSILMAGHHGSITFFDDAADTENYYTEHMRSIDPAMTIVSVGDNPHGHPNKKALELYKKYSRGSNNDNKIYTTQDKGTIKLILKDDGWSLNAV